MWPEAKGYHRMEKRIVGPVGTHLYACSNDGDSRDKAKNCGFLILQVRKLPVQRYSVTFTMSLV